MRIYFVNISLIFCKATFPFFRHVCASAGLVGNPAAHQERAAQFVKNEYALPVSSQPTHIGLLNKFSIAQIGKRVKQDLNLLMGFFFILPLADRHEAICR